MSTWGVLSLAGLDAARLAQHRRELSGYLDGLVAVPDEDHRASWHPSLHYGKVLGTLVAGLSSVPTDAERIAYLDSRALGSLGIEPVVQMMSWLDEDHAAVVRAVPVTDALKRVENDIIIGGVERSGLYVPQPPHVYRREALDQALLRTNFHPHGVTDPAGLLVATGHAVRVVRDAGPPFTLMVRS